MEGRFQRIDRLLYGSENFLDEQQIFMFESQSYETSQSRVVTAGILGGTFMADGNGYYYNGRYYSYIDTFMEAGQIAGVNPYFLASRVRQEVGGGSSAVDGSYGYYNFFNIGAYASASGNAVQNGMNYAAQTGTWRRPWTSPWLSIVGGAEFLASSYINVGQNTVTSRNSMWLIRHILTISIWAIFRRRVRKVQAGTALIKTLVYWTTVSLPLLFLFMIICRQAPQRFRQ